MHQTAKMTPSFAAVYTSVSPYKLHEAQDPGHYCAQHSSRHLKGAGNGEYVCAHHASLELTPSPPHHGSSGCGRGAFVSVCTVRVRVHMCTWRFGERMVSVASRYFMLRPCLGLMGYREPQALPAFTKLPSHKEPDPSFVGMEGMRKGNLCKGFLWEGLLGL